jgi:uncharacterized damage-inducible protein DinB
LGRFRESKSIVQSLGLDEKFPKHDSQEELIQLESRWLEVAQQRNAFVDSLDPELAAKVVIANPGKLRIPFRVIESMVQLCCHGTHHRAQIVNMLRQAGVKPPAIDLSFGLGADELGSSHSENAMDTWQKKNADRCPRFLIS